MPNVASSMAGRKHEVVMARNTQARTSMSVKNMASLNAFVRTYVRRTCDTPRRSPNGRPAYDRSIEPLPGVTLLRSNDDRSTDGAALTAS